MSERVVTAHIPQSLAEHVDELAERLDRPRGWIVREALSRFVDLEQKRHELMLESFAALDRGDVVDHADIEAWAKRIPGRRQSTKKR